MGSVLKYLLKIPRMPLVNKILTIFTTMGAVNDITKSFFVAFNPSFPSKTRMKGLARGVFCMGSVVFAFSARFSSDPGLKHKLKITSSAFGLIYIYSGGDVLIFMSIISNSRSLNEYN